MKWSLFKRTNKKIAESTIKNVAKANGTTLDLTGKGLTSDDFEALFPLIVQKLPNLRSLVLDNNPLGTLPSMEGLKKLFSLQLDNCDLTNLDGIKFPESLSILRLNDNKLTAEPNGIWDLPNLSTLYLDNNKLHALSPRVGALTKLFSLGLSGNHLIALPNELGNLSDLEELHVANNQLSVFPDSLRNLNQLKYVDASNNQLTSIEPILGSPGLLDLYAAQNKLRDLPPDFAKSIPVVRTLELEDNLFPEGMEVPTAASVRIENIMLKLEQARENDATALQLNNCFLTDDIIEKLIPLIASNCPNLEELYLHNNRLKKIPSIESLNKLKFLAVGGNRFSCIRGNPNFPESLEQIRGAELSWWPPHFDDSTATNNYLAPSLGRLTPTPPVSPPPRHDEQEASQVRSQRVVR